MTVDDIATALAADGALPKAAMREGVGLANELAPRVYVIAEKLCRGTFLIPTDNRLLLYGLPILAAARHDGLREHVLALARQPGANLEQLYPDYATVGLGRLIVTCWDGDREQLFGLIRDPAVNAEVKWGLFDIVARLTLDGRIPREATAGFLAALEHEGAFQGDDMTWWGWDEAVGDLALVELEPALRRVWAFPVYKTYDQIDFTDAVAHLHRMDAGDAGHNPDLDAIRPIDDPAEAVAWVEHRQALYATWAAEHAAEELTSVGHDPAGTIRLTHDKFEWLADFLVSQQAPPTTMSIEMLDGFFTALVIGPAMVPPSAYMREIWGGDGDGPIWDGLEQLEYVLGLLMKHWNTIAFRRTAGGPHQPHIGLASPQNLGAAWADGFVVGMDMAADAWDPMFSDRRIDTLIAPILALAGELPVKDAARFSSEMRKKAVGELPRTIQALGAYWQDPRSLLPRPAPATSTKVGRNEPCPCGSGRKYKKCCGGASAPSRH